MPREQRAPAYWAVVPAPVRHDKTLRPNAKLLYAEIQALADSCGYCWATNEYLAELLDIAARTVSDLISTLAKRGYITVEVLRDPKTNEVMERRIWVDKPATAETPPPAKNGDTPLADFCGTPPAKNGEENDYSSLSNNTPLTPQGEGDSLSDFEILDDGYSTTKGRKEKVPRKRKELDTSFVAPEFKSAVDEWIAYKSELGKPYKARGFKAFYNQLVNLSGGDPDKARKIIEQSMANNWQGIFTINETKNGKSNRTNQIMPPDPEEVSRAIYEGIARARTPQEWEL